MKKLIKSGAGAGYTVSIKGIELDDLNYKIISDEITDERYNEHTTRVEVPVKPCVVDEWSAESYYDIISSEHDFFNSTEDSKIEGGKAVLDVFWYQSEEGRNINDVEFESAEEACDALIPKDFGIQVLVGAGWSHSYLPVDKVHFEDEYHHNPLNYYEDGYDCAVISADLVCPNICQDINAFFENPEEYYDDYQGDEEIESSKKIRSGYSNNPDYVGDWYGKGQIDYSKIINPEDSGDVYMVKLWSGSGYVLDVYLAKAEDVYEAIDKVFKWSYENEGENEMVFDYNYLENQAANDYKDYEKHPDSWSYYGEGLSEEEFIDKWIDEAFVSDDNGLYARSENFFVDKLPEEYLNQSRKTIKSAMDSRSLGNFSDDLVVRILEVEAYDERTPSVYDFFAEGDEMDLAEFKRSCKDLAEGQNGDFQVDDSSNQYRQIVNFTSYENEETMTGSVTFEVVLGLRNDALGDYLVASSKKPLESMARQYMKPQYDARKSFYNKAETDDDKLYSYGTLVAEIIDGEPVLYDKWDYSATTLRHVKDWLRQNGFEAGSKQEIGRMYKRA